MNGYLRRDRFVDPIGPRGYSWGMRPDARWLAPILAVGLLACGGSAEQTRHAQTPIAEASPAPDAPPPAPPRREGTIARAELDAVLAEGLGRFLSHVVTEPHLDQGRFVGFRLREVDALFEGVDLAAGDTLLSINGAPIERPEQALSVWNGLRVASELTIEYLRAGERRQLRFEIAD